MRLLTATLIAAALVGAPSLAAATTEPPTTGSISITLDGPPEQRAATSVRLFAGADDVTDTYCAPPSTTDLDRRPLVTCTDLPDGTYAVTLVTTDDPMPVVTIECSDIVATRAEPDALVIGDRLDTWSCFANVSPPSILLRGGVFDPFDPVLLDDDGAEVACTSDDIGFEQRRWCTTPLGTYRIDETSIDPAFRDAIDCFADVRQVDLTPFDPFTGITVDGTVPWVGCEQLAVPGALLELRWTPAPGEDTTWFRDLVVTAFDGDRQPLPGDCTAENDGVGFALYGCPAQVGFVDFDIAGIPADATVTGQGIENGDCIPLDSGPGIQAICIAIIETPPPATTPVTELPETGTSTVLLVTGGTLFGAGIALVAATRRRPGRVVR